MSDCGCIRVSSADQNADSRLITLREAVNSDKKRIEGYSKFGMRNSECGIRN